MWEALARARGLHPGRRNGDPLRHSILNSPLKNPIYCDRLQSPLASFSSLDDLNVTPATVSVISGLGPRQRRFRSIS
jgi:hypothetical protein